MCEQRIFSGIGCTFYLYFSPLLYFLTATLNLLATLNEFFPIFFVPCHPPLLCTWTLNCNSLRDLVNAISLYPLSLYFSLKTKRAALPITVNN